MAVTTLLLEKSKTILLTGAAFSASGVILAATIAPRIGGVITLIGWTTAIVGLHFFGRSGRSK